MMNEMKVLIVSLCLSVLVACGAPVQQTATGVSQPTQIVVIADDLINAVVQIEDESFRVDKSRLTKYRMGVFGASDRDIEKMDILQLPVSPGDVQLKISKDGKTLINRKLYMTQGQTREISL
jgi:hypothetical protein